MKYQKPSQDSPQEHSLVMLLAAAETRQSVVMTCTFPSMDPAGHGIHFFDEA
jgi:hypothetical protein